MAPPSPSIQSFFSSSPSKPSPRLPVSSSVKPLSSISMSPSSTPSIPGDGFTAEEVGAVLHPPSAQWTPQRDYKVLDIGSLEPGPQFVTFMGRVVNLYDRIGKSKARAAAQGMLKLMVGDDTGAVTVRLYYANTTYRVHLGQLVTVWTVHISNGETASLAPTAAPLFTTMSPERERDCHVMLHENSNDGTMCKWPYGCKGRQAMTGLMTLKNFANGGYDVDDAKVLVCVRSIGAKKKFTNKAGFSAELVALGVFDDTAEAQITLCGATCSSTSYWQPSETVLLISQPGWRIDRRIQLSLTANTRLDVDPNTTDAAWLRALAQRLTKREHVNPPFPVGVFDLKAAQTAAVRILYTLADIDEFARNNPKERFMGYISVLITDLTIVSNYKRNMLMCTECCGIPIFSNNTDAQCQQCDKPRSLRLNPKILGPILDETGQLSSGKLIFSPEAWTQLLGRRPEDLASLTVEQLKYMEHRLSFVRLSLGFGWCPVGTVGRRVGSGGDGEFGLGVGDRDREDGGNGLVVEDAGHDTKARKRKKLDVFGTKAKSEPMDRATPDDIDDDSGKNPNTALSALSTAKAKTETKTKTRDLDNTSTNDPADVPGARAEAGELGRLCIWCVKV